MTTRTSLPYFLKAPISLTLSISVSIVFGYDRFFIDLLFNSTQFFWSTAWSEWSRKRILLRWRSRRLRGCQGYCERAAWSKWVAVWFFMTRWRRLVSIARVYSWFKWARTSTVWSVVRLAFWTSVCVATTVSMKRQFDHDPQPVTISAWMGLFLKISDAVPSRCSFCFYHATIATSRRRWLAL